MWTDFAMAVSNAIRGISCRTGHVGPEKSSGLQIMSANALGWVSPCPLSRLNK